MHRFFTITIGLICLACVHSLNADDDVVGPEYARNAKVRVNITGTPSPGYFLISPLVPDSIGLVDHAGVFIKGRQSGPSVNLTPTPYGGYTFYMGSIGKYVTIDDQLRLVDTFGIEAPFITDFHEGYQTRRRRYIVLGTEERTFDMSNVVPGGDPEAILIGAVVQEFDRYGRKTFDWRSLDHISVDETTSDIDLLSKRIDYIHVNSVSEDVDGNFLISCRNTDQIIKVSRSTGDVLWRLGGSSAKRTDITILNDDVDGFVGFSHQHSAIRARNGELLLFDNGVMRPDPFSRAVGYRIDETRKTAEKTWEFMPTERQFAPTMGSVQELEDGHIIVGWGSTQTGLLATEVDRSGTIHAEVRAYRQVGVSYRVHKAIIGMTGYRRTIDSARSYQFSWYDSTTYVTVDVSSVYDTSDVIVERHTYSPHDVEFLEETPCFLYPYRWVVRVEDPLALAGTMRFDVGRLIGRYSAEDMDIYYRPNEGEGAFVRLPKEVVPGTNTIRLSLIQGGEFTLASIACPDLALKEPLDKSKVTTEDVLLSWTNTIDADGYEIEFSSNPNFTDQLRFLRSDYPEIRVVGLEPDKVYYWRVRVIRRSEVGPWTNGWSFNTGMPTTVEAETTNNGRISLKDGHLVVEGFATNAIVTIADLLGRTVRSGDTSSPIDISALSRGPLYVVVETPQGVVERTTVLNLETDR